MPSIPSSPRPPQRSRNGVDWSSVRSSALRSAMALGLATKRSEPGPLLPGLGTAVSSFVDRQTERVAERVAQRVATGNGQGPAGSGAAATQVRERDGEIVLDRSAPRQPRRTIEEPVVDGPVLGRAVARLGVLSIATVVGLVGVGLVAAILFKPAASNATALVDVELNIPENASLP